MTRGKEPTAATTTKSGISKAVCEHSFDEKAAGASPGIFNNHTRDTPTPAVAAKTAQNKLEATVTRTLFLLQAQALQVVGHSLDLPVKPCCCLTQLRQAG